MKNNIKSFFALTLTLCTAAGILSACNNETTDNTTLSSATQTTEKITVIQSDMPYEIVSQNEAYTYFKPVTTQKSVMTYTYAAVPVKTTSAQPVTMPELTLNNQSNNNSDETKPEQASKTTQKNISNEIIEEKSKGITIVTKSSPVMSGNTATIMIQGKPKKKYTIDFYESSSKKADYSGLEIKTADSNGFVTWSFEIEDSCELGNRKIYIKENGSGNYLQTSIKVC